MNCGTREREKHSLPIFKLGGMRYRISQLARVFCRAPLVLPPFQRAQERRSTLSETFAAFLLDCTPRVQDQQKQRLERLVSQLAFAVRRESSFEQGERGQQKVRR